LKAAGHVDAGEEAVDTVVVQIMSCQRTVDGEIGPDGGIVERELRHQGVADAGAVEVDRFFNAVGPGVVLVLYRQVDIRAIRFSVDADELVAVVVLVDPDDRTGDFFLAGGRLRGRGRIRGREPFFVHNSHVMS